MLGQGLAASHSKSVFRDVEAEQLFIWLTLVEQGSSEGAGQEMEPQGVPVNSTLLFDGQLIPAREQGSASAGASELSLSLVAMEVTIHHPDYALTAEGEEELERVLCEEFVESARLGQIRSAFQRYFAARYHDMRSDQRFHRLSSAELCVVAGVEWVNETWQASSVLLANPLGSVLKGAQSVRGLGSVIKGGACAAEPLQTVRRVLVLRCLTPHGQVCRWLRVSDLVWPPLGLVWFASQLEGWAWVQRIKRLQGSR
jgi:hypothetical protein